MNNEAFFDILGELDDDIICDAAISAVHVREKKSYPKGLLMTAAAVILFIISGFILSENGKTENMELYESTKNSIAENISGDISHSSEKTDESITSENTATDITTEVFTAFSDMTTDSHTVSDETTGNIQFLPEEDSTEKNSSEDEPKPVFSQVSPTAFLEILPSDSFDSAKYTKEKTVSGSELENIYGTKVIPDYIPVSSSSGSSVNTVPSDNTTNDNYTVYFTADFLEVYSSHELVFIVPNGVLTVKASTRPFALYKEETLNSDSLSVINGVSVLLLAGRIANKNVVLDAQFEKDGVYFRVLLRGVGLVEEEFIKILKSLI